MRNLTVKFAFNRFAIRNLTCKFVYDRFPGHQILSWDDILRKSFATRYPTRYRRHKHINISQNFATNYL